jgi:hypothetical protein
MIEPMADEPADQTPPQGPSEEGVPSEEELRAAYEEQIRSLKVQDLVLQSAVSVLNLSARRIAKDDERDLEQAKVGIDAARALVDLVPEEAQAQLRQAVSELQLLYAKHAGEGDSGAGDSSPEPPKKPDGPGLWTPGG